MKEKIINYLWNQPKMTEKVANIIYENLKTHPDIFSEFIKYIEDGKFPTVEQNPIVIEGYTAQKLSETTYLDPIGAYNFLVSLRDDPLDAINDLKKGLPRK